MKKSISVGISMAALMIVLSHAEAEAGPRGKRFKYRGKQSASPRRARSAASRVVKRGARRYSRLRERARQVEHLIAAAAVKYKVDPYAIWVIAYNETRFRWWLVSPAKAKGMMQFIDSTARAYGLQNPFNVPDSIDAAARYVRNSSDQFGGRLDLILASYNAGPAAVEAYQKGIRIVSRNGKVINPRRIVTGGVPPYTETRKYVSQGLKVYRRVKNVGLFSNEVMAQTRRVNIPETEGARTLIAAYSLNDKELDEIGGPQSAMIAAGFSDPKPAAESPKKPTTTSAASDKNLVAAKAAREAVIEEVFFDVHSGVRYLVRGGEIVKPIEPAQTESSATPQRKPNTNTFVVAKSSFYGRASE